MSKKLPKNDFTRKMIDFGHLYKKLPKTVGDLGKLIVSKGFKNLPKVQNIAQSGHTGWKGCCVMGQTPMPP